MGGYKLLRRDRQRRWSGGICVKVQLGGMELLLGIQDGLACGSETENNMGHTGRVTQGQGEDKMK